METTQTHSSRLIVIAVALLLVAGLLFLMVSMPVASRAPDTTPVSDAVSVSTHGAATGQSDILALADTNRDGNVSENEALLLTLNVADALGKTDVSIQQFDVNADGIVDSTDATIIFADLERFVP